MAYIRFSTQDYPSAERLEAVQDVYAAMGQSDIDVSRGEIPHVETRIRLLPGVSVALIECSTMTVKRGRKQLADDNDDVVLLLNPGGEKGQRVRYQQGKDILENPTGGGSLGFNGQPGSVSFQGPNARLLGLTFPRSPLSSRVADLDRKFKRRLVQGEPLRFLMQQALELTFPSRLLTPSEAIREAAQLLDLATLTLGATQDAGVRALNGGLSAARLRAIKGDLAANADNSRLSLEWLAGRHGVSPRYIRALFERGGTSFTDHLLELRLQRAFARLRSPVDRRRPIVEIAYATGFNNLSWFYRAFSRRFGMTPGDVQANSAQQEISE